MGKLLRQIRHGVYKLGEAAEFNVGFGRSAKVYYKPIPELKLPRNPRESMKRDMQNIGADMYHAIEKCNVK